MEWQVTAVGRDGGNRVTLLIEALSQSDAVAQVRAQGYMIVSVTAANMRQAPVGRVEITTKNTPSLTLGIIALVLGVLAMIVGWIPFVGLLSIPVALIGLLLAGIGGVIALVKGFKGMGMPLLGGFVSILAIVLPIASTGGTSKVMSDAMEHDRTKRQQAKTVSDAQEVAYAKQYLEIYDVNATYRDSLLDGRIPGLTFKIRNKGAKTLNRVRVTAYFKDKAGTTIAEESYSPVNVNGFSPFGDNKPLKPNYVWQIESDKFYAAKSVPAEWAEGRVELVIDDIEFGP